MLSHNNDAKAHEFLCYARHRFVQRLQMPMELIGLDGLSQLSWRPFNDSKQAMKIGELLHIFGSKYFCQKFAKINFIFNVTLIQKKIVMLNTIL
jgi:hypothetical protein